MPNPTMATMKPYTQYGMFFPTASRYKYADTKQKDAHISGRIGDLCWRKFRISQAMEREKIGIAPT